jgi:hypothetical protein
MMKKELCIMKTSVKRALSILLTLALVVSMFAGLSLGASAAAAESLTIQVMGKDGLAAAWEEVWYFQDGTSENGYMDSAFTRNADGTGGELSLATNFTNYPGFESYGSLVYSGWRRTWPILACCKRGILLEDLISYVETQSGYGELRGDTGIQVSDPTGFILPDSQDPATDGKYGSYFWGNATRYYYPDFYTNTAIGGDDTYCTGSYATNGIVVPTVLAMVGYYYNTAGTTLETIQNSSDTLNSLRLFFGMDPNNLHDGTGGNGSVKNVNQIWFYPVYNAIAVSGGTAVGTEGESGYGYSASNATVTASDNWFKAAEGETVSLNVTPDSGYAIDSVSVTEVTSGNAVTATPSGNTYTFTMPADAVTVSVSTSGSVSPAAHAVTLPASLDGIWSMTASSAGGTDAAVGTPGTAEEAQTVTLTVTRAEDALTSSIGGISVSDGGNQSVEVTEVSSTPGDGGTVKEAVYSFVMPGSDVTVSLTEDYSGLTVSEREYPGAAATEKKAYTRAQLNAMDEEGDFYYGGFDSTPAVIEGRATVSVPMLDLLEDAGVEFLPGDSVTFTAADGNETTLTYSELYSAGRYYFPALYTGDSWAAKSNGKILCQPHLVITGALAQTSDRKSVV